MPEGARVEKPRGTWGFGESGSRLTWGFRIRRDPYKKTQKEGSPYNKDPFYGTPQIAETFM